MNRTISVIAIASLLERIAFGCIYTFIIIYCSYQQFDIEVVRDYFLFLAISLALSQLLGGLITDLFFSHERGIILGAILVLTGLILLRLEIQAIFDFSLALVMIGTGFVRPNLFALTTRLYVDKPKLLFYFGLMFFSIYLGYFWAGIIMEYFNFPTWVNWKGCLRLMQFVTFLYLSLFLFAQRKKLFNYQIEPPVVDLQKDIQPLLYLFGLVAVFNLIFELTETKVKHAFSTLMDHQIISVNVGELFTKNDEVLYVIISGILLFFWTKLKLGNTLKYCAILVLTMAVSYLLMMSFGTYTSTESFVLSGFVSLLVITLEIAFSALYIYGFTKYYNSKFLTTGIGLLFCIVTLIRYFIH